MAREVTAPEQARLDGLRYIGRPEGAGSYRPVPTSRSASGHPIPVGRQLLADDDDDENEVLDERERLKRLWVERLNYVWYKVQAVLWVAASIYVIYYTNLFRVMWECPNVKRVFLYLGFGCLGFCICCLFYIAVVIPWQRDDMIAADEELDKKVIPVMTCIGLAAAVL